MPYFSFQTTTTTLRPPELFIPITNSSETEGEVPLASANEGLVILIVLLVVGVFGTAIVFLLWWQFRKKSRRRRLLHRLRHWCSCTRACPTDTASTPTTNTTTSRSGCTPSSRCPHARSPSSFWRFFCCLHEPEEDSEQDGTKPRLTPEGRWIRTPREEALPGLLLDAPIGGGGGGVDANMSLGSIPPLPPSFLAGDVPLSTVVQEMTAHIRTIETYLEGIAPYYYRNVEGYEGKAGLRSPFRGLSGNSSQCPSLGSSSSMLRLQGGSGGGGSSGGGHEEGREELLRNGTPRRGEEMEGVDRHRGGSPPAIHEGGNPYSSSFSSRNAVSAEDDEEEALAFPPCDRRFTSYVPAPPPPTTPLHSDEDASVHRGRSPLASPRSFSPTRAAPPAIYSSISPPVLMEYGSESCKTPLATPLREEHTRNSPSQPRAAEGRGMGWWRGNRATLDTQPSSQREEVEVGAVDSLPRSPNLSFMDLPPRCDLPVPRALPSPPPRVLPPPPLLFPRSPPPEGYGSAAGEHRGEPRGILQHTPRGTRSRVVIVEPPPVSSASRWEPPEGFGIPTTASSLDTQGGMRSGDGGGGSETMDPSASSLGIVHRSFPGPSKVSGGVFSSTSSSTFSSSSPPPVTTTWNARNAPNPLGAPAAATAAAYLDWREK